MTVKLPDGQELNLGDIAALPGLIAVGRVEVFRVGAGGVLEAGPVVTALPACDPDGKAVTRLTRDLATTLKREIGLVPKRRK